MTTESPPVLHTMPPSAPNIYDLWENFIKEFISEFKTTGRFVLSNISYTYCSCGVSILAGLHYSSPKDIVNKILVERHPDDYKKTREAFVIFSDSDMFKDREFSGFALAKYIRDNNLGPIHEVGPRMNPNTENMISLWVWQPPHESLKFRDRYMEVYGKVIQRSPNGSFAGYENKPFSENRNIKGA